MLICKQTEPDVEDPDRGKSVKQSTLLTPHHSARRKPVPDPRQVPLPASRPATTYRPRASCEWLSNVGLGMWR